MHPDLTQARTFLELLDPAAEAFTFQTFDDRPAKRRELARVIHGPLEAVADQLAALNARGAGVYVTVNETDGRGRRCANIVRIRVVFVDLDGAPLEPVLEGPLAPSCTIESSPDKFHAYWRVDDLPLERFKAVQQAIAARFGGDPAVCDLPRVMRLPGFHHLKGEPFCTHILSQGDPAPYAAGQVLEPFAQPSATTADEAEPDDRASLDELVRQVMTAEAYHEPLVRLAWRYLAAGMPAGRVVETLQGLLRAAPEPHDERWQARYDDVERTVTSAEAKQRGPTSLSISLEWLREVLRPRVYGDDGRILDTNGKWRKLTELHPDGALLDRIAVEASDPPRLTNGNISRNQLPTHARKWVGVAWGELRNELPDERSPEATLTPVAAEELEVMLTNLLASPLMFQLPSGRVCIASLGSWAKTCACQRPGPWRRVGDLPLWAKLTADGLLIGIRPELAARMRTCPAIASMSLTKLTRACKSHGLSDAEVSHVYDEREGPQRATILGCEFVATLGTVDLMTDPNAAALAEIFASGSAVRGAGGSDSQH